MELVARELAYGDSAMGCRARHQGGWLSAPHRGQRRTSRGPGWQATQNKSAGPTKLHGTRHGSGQRQCAVVRLSPRSTGRRNPKGPVPRRAASATLLPDSETWDVMSAGTRRAAQCDREIIPQPVTPKMESPEGPSFDFITRWPCHLVYDSCQPQGSRYPHKEPGD